MSGFFPEFSAHLYRDKKGRVQEVRKEDLRAMVGRWMHPDMERYYTPHERNIIRSLASDVDYVIRGGRFVD